MGETAEMKTAVGARLRRLLTADSPGWPTADVRAQIVDAGSDMVEFLWWSFGDGRWHGSPCGCLRGSCRREHGSDGAQCPCLTVALESLRRGDEFPFRTEVWPTAC